MLELHWFALTAFAFFMSVAWLFIERRITTTSALAGATWALAAVSGGDLTRITQDGTEVAVEVGVLQYICTLMALLSLLVLILYRFGEYPPGPDDPINPNERPARAD